MNFVAKYIGKLTHYMIITETNITCQNQHNLSKEPCFKVSEEPFQYYKYQVIINKGNIIATNRGRIFHKDKTGLSVITLGLIKHM